MMIELGERANRDPAVVQHIVAMARTWELHSIQPGVYGHTPYSSIIAYADSIITRYTGFGIPYPIDGGHTLACYSTCIPTPHALCLAHCLAHCLLHMPAAFTASLAPRAPLVCRVPDAEVRHCSLSASALRWGVCVGGVCGCVGACACACVWYL